MLLARLVNRQDHRGHHAKLRAARIMLSNDMESQVGECAYLSAHLVARHLGGNASAGGKVLTSLLAMLHYGVMQSDMMQQCNIVRCFNADQACQRAS